jgi:hypothetical protein
MEGAVNELVVAALPDSKHNLVCLEFPGKLFGSANQI